MGLFTKSKHGFLGASAVALHEIQATGEAAARAATKTLEKLTRTTVSIPHVQAYLVPKDRIHAVLSHHHGAQVGARFPLGGTHPGSVATLFTRENALELVALLMGREPGSVKKLGKLEESAIAEMTNIALNGAINVLSEHTGTRFDTGVPVVEMKVEDLGIFLGFDAARDIDHALVVDARFHESKRDITGDLVMVFGVRGQAPS